MDIVLAFAEKVMELTVEPIGRQLGYLVSYHDNIKELKDQHKLLEDERDSLMHAVDAARRNGEEIENNVQQWLDSVTMTIEKAQRFYHEESQANTGCSLRSCPNLHSRHHLSRKANTMTQEIVNIRSQRKFDGVSYRKPPQWIATSSTSFSRRSEKAFESRTTTLNSIIEALADPSVNMVGLYGIGGVGKTTLAKEVAKKTQEEMLFETVVMVNVTKDINQEKIQKQIGDMVGLKLDEASEFIRAGRLNERLKQEKRILIILDDLWERLDLVNIGIPSTNEHKGCKVLMTSRSEEVLSNKMNSGRNIMVTELSENEAQDLFMEMAGLHGDSDPDLLSKAAEVAQECAGLPIAIVTVARALKNKSLFEWRDALRQLQIPALRNDTGVTKEVDSRIKFSYEHLGTKELKSVFLLSAMLSNTALISDLFKYCMGLGLFQGKYTVEGAQDRLYTLIRELKALCLLLDSDSGDCFRMHDVVRDVALSIACNEQGAFVVRYDKLYEWPENNHLENCRWMCLDESDINELPKVSHCPRLEVFLFEDKQNDLRIPDNFFRRMSALRVMDLTRFHFSYLPPSIALLTNLSTLCLDQCVLEDITIVGELNNLRALSLIHSTIQHLPKEFGQLTRLQLLDLSYCSKLRVIPQNVISSMNKLEALHLRDSFNQWQNERSNSDSTNANVGELKHLPNLSTLDVHVMDASMLPKDWSFDKLGRYKLLIGDVWKWPGMYETSKTLKLKLNTSIHLENGLKRFLERVEDLYLDELCGAKNVLFELNGSGFPHLKHLWIQNNTEIECIINSTTQPYKAFPKLETLILENMISLDKLCYGQLTMKSFSNLRVIKVRSCNRLKSLFSISIMRSISQTLEEMEISSCKLLQHIVDLSNPDNLEVEIHQLRSLILEDLPALGVCFDQNKSFSINLLKEKQFEANNSADKVMTNQNLDALVSLFSDKVAFPKLDSLKLSSINSEKIWQDHISASFWIQNLTNLTVEGCKNLRYIMSIAVATSLEKLKRLVIRRCEMVENILVTKGMTDTQTTPKSIDPIFIEEVIFPNLETLVKEHMDNLQKIWEHRFALKSFSKLKTVEINYCEKLAIVVPLYMITNLQYVEKMTVSHCSSLETIFDMLDVNIKQARDCGELVSKLRTLSLLQLSSLRHIWNTDPHSVLGFDNLQTVHVINCGSLKNIFPSTVALSLVLLEELKVQYCGVEEIVAKEQQENAVTINFVLPRLISIILVNLWELKRFYLGLHTLECPMLKELNVLWCDKMELFEVESLNFAATGHQLDQIDESIQKPLFYAEKIIPALEKFSLSGKDAKKIWQANCPANNMRLIQFQNFSEAQFPYWFLHRMPNLETLLVKYSSFTELFPSMRELGAEERQTADVVRLKVLFLLSLPKLESICVEGSQVDPVLYKLERLYVKKCSGLKNLVISSASFNCLTRLEVSKCNGLLSLMSSSTARSLVHLKGVTLKECTMLREIVASEGDETHYDIAFRQLVSLELTSLPSLISFCSGNINLDFPCLVKVIVKECPRMKIFSQGESRAPRLQNVQQERDGQPSWEGGLNSTIIKLFNNYVAYRGMEAIKLDEYPELRHIWDGKFPDWSFTNLKSLVIENCDFVCNVIPPYLICSFSNLEELVVRNCAYTEVVFDLQGTKETHSLLPIALKSLTLQNLPKLRHIWKNDPHSVLSFNNLRTVHVVECGSLKNIFPSIVALSLVLLEELNVGECGVEEIVAKEEQENAVTINFVLPRLISIILVNLWELKRFYPGLHTLECPMLKELNVLWCDKMELFEVESLNFAATGHQLDQIDDSIQKPLFYAEKIIPALEKFSLSGKDAKKIWQAECPTNNMRVIRFQRFSEAQFPYWFLHRMPNLETMVVKYSSFTELFPSIRELGAEERQTADVVRLKQLNLWSLPKLESFCIEGSQVDPVLYKLERLYVWECSGLKNLVPSSVSLNCLTRLEVSKCNGLVSLISPSTAKSLVHLKWMTLKECTMLREIVANDGDETQYEIAFCQLVSLELTSLPSLISFCSGNIHFDFPYLEEVIVKECPKMKMFSQGESRTPRLQNVQQEEEDHPSWEGNLNSTIIKLFTNKNV